CVPRRRGVLSAGRAQRGVQRGRALRLQLRQQRSPPAVYDSVARPGGRGGRILEGRMGVRALSAALLLALPALASGEKYRIQEPAAPVAAPSEVTLKPGGGGKGGAVPSIDIEVVDEKGAPVAGLGIGVSAFQSDGKREFLQSATDAAGHAALKAEAGRRAASLTIAFQGDGGSRTVRAKLEPGKGGWQLTGAPDQQIV